MFDRVITMPLRDHSKCTSLKKGEWGWQKNDKNNTGGKGNISLNLICELHDKTPFHDTK